MLAHEYGYSLDNIAGMSLREVQWCIDAIAKRQRKVFSLDASLHGMRVSGDCEQEPAVKISPEMEKTMEQHYKEAFNRKRMAARHG